MLHGNREWGESVDQLLLHGEVARALWNNFFGSVVLSWVMPRRIVASLPSRDGNMKSPNCSSVDDGSYLLSVVYLKGNN